MIRTAPRAITILAALILAGCSSQPYGAGTVLRPPDAETLNAAPKQLVQTVKRIVTSPPLNLTVTEEKAGTILTSYKEGYTGELHIVRHWQERTRFLIRVIPDWDEPTARSRLEVSKQTQTRSNPHAEWQADPEAQRPERSAELLKTIKEQVH